METIIINTKELQQGTKVKFKTHHSRKPYTGRIEVNKYGELFFMNEHCFENNELKEIHKPLRHYNRLDSYAFASFKIL